MPLCQLFLLSPIFAFCCRVCLGIFVSGPKPHQFDNVCACVLLPRFRLFCHFIALFIPDLPASIEIDISVTFNIFSILSLIFHISELYVVISFTIAWYICLFFHSLYRWILSHKIQFNRASDIVQSQCDTVSLSTPVLTFCAAFLCVKY